MNQFQSLEKALNRARVQAARQARVDNPNLVFRDVKKPRGLPVQTIATHAVTRVVQVNEEGTEVQYDPQVLDVSTPVQTQGGFLRVTNHEPGKLQLVDSSPIEVGDILQQRKMIADLDEIFNAFRALWEPMWNKHRDVDISRWTRFIQFVRDNVPVPAQPFVWTPITLDQWDDVVKSKKSTSATGPDGLSKSDLMRMPKALRQILVDIVNQINQG